MELSEREYSTLEAAPVDGTSEPDPETVPGPINVISDEIEAATEEDLQIIIEKERKVVEPEIAATYDLDPVQSVGEARAVPRTSYMTLHPTHFDWRADVARAVNRVQAKVPWETYANTYYMHPPVYGRKYEFVSVDFWGGGLSNDRYVGYRGKPIGTSLGHQVWNEVFNDPHLPNIHWIIWNGRMWVRGSGWGPSPWGPPDSDPGHYNHIHVTYVL